MSEPTRRPSVAIMVTAGIAALLAVAPYLARGGLRTFITLDDPFYVVQNREVLPGLTLKGVFWAFGSFDHANWHPLTWLSHMLDVSLFGLDARGHHMTSIALHGLNAAILFLVLLQLTGARLKAACAAALFGVHPLRVESVAWVSERKDVLSGLFFLMLLLAWARYVRRGGNLRYTLAFVLLGLGLMAKPMLVTVPFVLLLLDFWPLGRAHPLPSPQEGTTAPGNISRLCVEKLPLLALCAASALLTILAQRAGGALATLSDIPAALRFSNAVISWVRYVGKTLWPSPLAISYPYPPFIPGWQFAGALGVLGLLTFTVLRTARTSPFLATGWFWFLGMLVPVIGLVQVGEQALADRYTYLPGIGLAVAVVWGVPELLRRLGLPRFVAGIGAGTAIVALATVTVVRTGVWRDSETLLRHSLAAAPGSWLVHGNLGALLVTEGRLQEAVGELEEALRLNPADPEAHFNLGTTLVQRGRLDEAEIEYREALRLRPGFPQPYRGLGDLFAQRGRPQDAIALYRKALQLRPAYPEAYNGLGLGFAELGSFDAAAAQYQEALRLRPEYPEARHNLGIALAALGRRPEAIEQYREALRLRPDFAETQQNLGAQLAQSGQRAEAIDHLREAVRLRPEYPEALYNLGVACLLEGRRDEAIASLREAVRLRPDFVEAREQLAIALRSKRH